MPTVINNKYVRGDPFTKRGDPFTKRGDPFTKRGDILSGILPTSLIYELSKYRQKNIEEIRCRLSRRTYVTVDGKNMPLEHVTSREEMDRMLDGVCGGSVYAHRDTLIQGYVTLEDGVRVGVCGSAAIEKGSVIGIYDVTSLNFRIPSPLLYVGKDIEFLIRSGGGVLIYSPAGEGKTTLLRALIHRLSSGELPLRVCVVDTRGELSAMSEEWGECADLLIGYPKSQGIEIATRTMNAQLIVCDEIGSADEARAILGAQNCGIPFLATTHGKHISDIFRREGIRVLHEGAVFENYVGITRKRAARDFVYRITSREAADEYF